MRRLPSFLSVLLVLPLLACRPEPLDISGQWVGEANLIVDGEQKTATLSMELLEGADGWGGTILWNDLKREITNLTLDGRTVHIESDEPNDLIQFNGLVTGNTLEGRFAIRYKIDPEPYPGRFSVSRQ